MIALWLAEIGDKMPSVHGTALIACSIAGIALVFGLARRWTVFLFVPVFALYDWAMIGELREPNFGSIVVRELGHAWIAGQLVAWNLPYAVALAIVLALPRRLASHRPGQPGHCHQCGYPLYGLPEPRCPECGTPAAPWPLPAEAHPSRSPLPPDNRKRKTENVRRSPRESRGAPRATGPGQPCAGHRRR
jgi:hypothetical protein